MQLPVAGVQPFSIHELGTGGWSVRTRSTADSGTSTAGERPSRPTLMESVSNIQPTSRPCLAIGKSEGLKYVDAELGPVARALKPPPRPEPTSSNSGEASA